MSYILHILAMDVQWICQLWQICEYHYTLGLFPAIFIIPTNGIYAGLVESSSNLPFYFHKINFNSILPSIFGLNLPKSPIHVFKGNFVCISQLQWKITEIQPSLVIADLIFLKHIHLAVKCLLFLTTASDVLTLCRSTAFYSRFRLVNELKPI